MVEILISNLGVILLTHILIGTVADYLSNKFSYKHLNAILQIIIASGGIITMYFLSILSHGYHFDLRIVLIVFIAAYYGPTRIIPIVLITSAFRMAMGGPTAQIEILYSIVIPALIAVFFYPITNKKSSNLIMFSLTTFGFLLSDIILILSAHNIDVIENHMFLIYRYFSVALSGFIIYSFMTSDLKQLELTKKLEVLSERDALTNLYNMTKFEEVIKQTYHSDNTYYIAMVDIDYFKQINDEYGHQGGDFAIQSVANVFKKYCSDDFVVGRYGGDEYVFYLKELSMENVKERLDAIRKEVNSIELYYGKYEQPIRISLSMGISELIGQEYLRECIEKADRQLYFSKNNGRNQICG